MVSMKSLFHAISLAMVALFGGGQLSAQGTLLFSNVRTDAPISRAGIGLEPGYLVELALLLPSDGLGVKGIRLSKEAPFLCCGLFGGGIVSVPGVPAGEEVEVVLVVSQPNPLDVDEGFFGPAWGGEQSSVGSFGWTR